jgi:hypothetical protein
LVSLSPSPANISGGNAESPAGIARTPEGTGHRETIIELSGRDESSFFGSGIFSGMSASIPCRPRIAGQAQRIFPSLWQ